MWVGRHTEYVTKWLLVLRKIEPAMFLNTNKSTKLVASPKQEGDGLQQLW